jgi:hypothetical protein
MPWEWRQANAFTEQQRQLIAARYVRQAVLAGHLSSPACVQVMDRYDRGQPISDELWERVKREHAAAFTNYDAALRNVGLGGATDPALAFRTARAAEVILCLQNAATAEGCADLLYATRLAGAPLKASAAVA